MDDRRFRKTVVLVCGHDNDHAMGIVLNRPLGKPSLPELLDQLGVPGAERAPKRPVLDGGPCQRDRGFVLHSDDWDGGDSTIAIRSGLKMTATREVLQELVEGGAPARARLALGYAGWGPGQLEQEIKAGAWLIGEADDGLVFGTAKGGDGWAAALDRLGLSAFRLSGRCGNA